MSAVPQALPRYRPMRAADLDAVVAIELEIYTHPWTLGNFRDSLSAGYSCWVLECDGALWGYGVLMMGVDEAHLLNLSIARERQRAGLGRQLLEFFVGRAREMGAQVMFLEVRPSNVAGRGLYASAGFREMAVRKNYYPADRGREDAILMGRDL
ncbi:MAG: ribosomal protein S18-alanine N-acetyltransferase [Burkholderiales bacterium]|nr:ribosomal protein S18-alanine N-acetyltransferase [Burkholderiales bacterium]